MSDTHSAASYSSDLITASSLVIIAAILLLFVLWPAYGALTLLGLSIPAGFYALNWIVFPIIWSRKVEIQSDIALEFLQNKIEVRTSEKIETCAIDLFFRKYLILSKSDFESKPAMRDLKLAHETAHIVNKDSRYFHFNMSCFFILLCTSYFSLAHITIDQFLIFGISTFFDTQAAAFYVLVCIYFFAIFILFVWFRENLHDREFAADRYAAELTGSSYVNYLVRIQRRSELPKINSASFRFPINLRNLLSDFLHPSIRLRISKLTDNPGSQFWAAHSKSWKAALYAVLMMFCGALMLMTSLSNIGGMLPSEFAEFVLHLPNWMRWFPLFIGGIGISAIAVIATEILRNGSMKDLSVFSIFFAVYCVTFPILMFTLVTNGTYLINTPQFQERYPNGVYPASSILIKLYLSTFLYPMLCGSIIYSYMKVRALRSFVFLAYLLVPALIFFALSVLFIF